MKFYNNRGVWLGFLLAVVLLAPGCEDKWDTHYEGNENDMPDYGHIMDYLVSDPDLSVFTAMVKEVGYDTLLSATQSYTVYAPLNEALSSLDLSNEDARRNFVENHISRGSIPYSLFDTERLVPLMNGKRIYLYGDGEEVQYGTVPFNRRNIRTGNGLVHRLNGYVPYTPNLREFLTRGEGIDSLQTYINSLTKLEFDAEGSVQLGFDADGNAVYDSVFVETNSYLDQRSGLGIEDSVQSVLLLTDAAWNDGYAKIRPYFNFPSARGGEVRSDKLTKEMMVEDLVLLTDGRNFSALDSVLSIIHSAGIYRIFYDPSYLFAGAEELVLSNGRGFKHTHFPFVDTLHWLRPISVEAEYGSSRTSPPNNYYYSVRSSRGLDEDISGSGFLILESSLPGDAPKSSVTFSVPNVLAGKYKLYVEFLPTSLENPDVKLPSKASFMVTHLNTDTGGSRRIRVSTLETNPDSKTKLFITDLDLPYANIVDEEYKTAALTIQITNETRLAEENAGEYTRSMRIDRILLEPVVESLVE